MKTEGSTPTVGNTILVVLLPATQADAAYR